ncbi:YgfZ/GcvT domain-containing protein [Luteolibacter luteus]|uniref:Folate-binding protein YgfZ n=1 Tax=Luteolibacter luteus TaxID=2728835 RepID=A0A858RJM5_9BACT|nr:folate-binding protein YgfZ [Luteolibacter luteus]QJE97476.1 folate-binding protein YgfZ [Luteolibacter luteus]
MSDIPSCLPAAKHSLLAFRGPDAVRYLNGQLTQDVRKLEDKALPACVTDAKGKLQFFVHVFRGQDDSIWIEGPANLAEELEARLTRYLIADDVEVENLSEAWQLVHVPGAATSPEAADGFARKASRIGIEGFDLWVPTGTEIPYPALSTEEAEAARIAAGVPAWNAELTEGMLPPEAGLDRNAISYHKGCYIGQEVLSRIKTAGKVNRRLARFTVPAGVKPGDELQLPDAEKSAGVITSVSPVADPSGEFAALGYVEKAGFESREFRDPGAGALITLNALL